MGRLWVSVASAAACGRGVARATRMGGVPPRSGAARRLAPPPCAAAWASWAPAPVRHPMCGSTPAPRRCRCRASRRRRSGRAASGPSGAPAARAHRAQCRRTSGRRRTRGRRAPPADTPPTQRRERCRIPLAPRLPCRAPSHPPRPLPLVAPNLMFAGLAQNSPVDAVVGLKIPIIVLSWPKLGATPVDFTSCLPRAIGRASRAHRTPLEAEHVQPRRPLPFAALLADRGGR